MIPKAVKQTCPKCKGTGTSSKILKDRDGNVILAPPYHKGEGDRPQYENCAACGGEGVSLQPLPQKIFIDGEKVELSPEEARARYAVPA